MRQFNRSVTQTALFLLVACFCVTISPVSADIRLPSVINDNMVLQRDVPIPIWGWADPRERIKVELGPNQVRTRADAQGKWMVKLPATKPGGPYEMTLTGKNTIHLTDILVGEVWFCSGQSNMDMRVGACDNAEQEIAGADYPQIRLFKVPRKPSGRPISDVDAVWRLCSSDTIPSFSAAAYYFGRELHQQLGVPVGLINSSWGGTRIEPWTPPAGFRKVATLKDIAEKIEQADSNYKKDVSSRLARIEEWTKDAKKALAKDAPVPLPPDFPQYSLSSSGHPVQPTELYNGMVHPIVPFAIRGAIWYQGEANVGEGMMYYEKTKALIGGWREVWGLGDFPYYYVQIAPFRYRGDPLRLPGIWEAQTAGLSIPNTGMAVTVDTVADIEDIHPTNKQDVGKRLALWALAKAYGRSELVYSGPLYKSMSVEGGKIRINFDHVGSGLTSREGKGLTWFEIASAYKRFVKAETQIDGDTVIVWNDSIASPVAVRFGWHQEAQPNLSNKEGLPALPFRTDRW
ncbi:MAG: sialate O-acetylesterase [Planctomycetota bacterium]|jgi:sialate O-acetylesterase